MTEAICPFFSSLQFLGIKSVYNDYNLLLATAVVYERSLVSLLSENVEFLFFK